MILLGNRLRTVPTNAKVFLHGFLNVQEKQILTSVINLIPKWPLIYVDTNWPLLPRSR